MGSAVEPGEEGKEKPSDPHKEHQKALEQMKNLGNTGSFPRPNLKLVGREEGEPNLANYMAIPLEAIPCGVPLPYSLFVRIAGKFVKFRQRGDILSSDRVQGLARGRVDSIHIQKTEWNHFIHSMEALIFASEQQVSKLTTKEQGTHVRNVLVAYSRELERKRTMERPELARFRKLSDRLTTLVAKDPSLTKALIRRYQDPNLYFINHGINVAIYSIAIGVKRGLPLPSLRLLALSGLLHNIGNILVPPELLYKRGGLTPQEKMLVDAHTIHGAKLLSKLGAPKEVIQVARQHHDRADGKNRSDPVPLHMFSKIVSIADVFNALTSPRPHQVVALKAEQAVVKMREMEGKFDTSVLNTVAPQKKK